MAASELKSVSRYLPNFYMGESKENRIKLFVCFFKKQVSKPNFSKLGFSQEL